MTTDFSTRIASSATVGLLLAASGGEARAAGTDINAVVKNMVLSVSTMPNLITALCYVGGIGLGATGIFRLKQHVDAPGQVTLSGGVARLFAGGGLLAAPYIAGAMVGTVKGASTGSISADNFNAMSY